MSSLPRSESGGATSCPALTGSLSMPGPLPHTAHDIHPRHMGTFGDLYPVDVTLKYWGHTQAGLRLTPVSVFRGSLLLYAQGTLIGYIGE